MSTEKASTGTTYVIVWGMTFAGFTSYTLGNPLGWVGMHAMGGWAYLFYICLGGDGSEGARDISVWDEPAATQATANREATEPQEAPDAD